MKVTVSPQFPTHCICHSASSTPSNNNNFLSAYDGKHFFLRSRIIFVPSTALATRSACGGQPEDPLTGWYVPPSSIFTTPDHTYEFPCADLVVHRPCPSLQFFGGFGSDIGVYIKVDSSVAIVHHSIVRAFSPTAVRIH